MRDAHSYRAAESKRTSSMKTLIASVAVFSCLLASVKAECPAIEDIPVVHPHKEHTFECAKVYPGPGYVNDQLACNSCLSEGNYAWDCPDNGENVGQSGYYYPVGSLIVLPGCTFTGFSDTYYSGTLHEFEGPLTQSYVPYAEESGSICGYIVYGYESYKCRCVQEFISCDPTDQYVEVIACDNLESDIEMTCSFQETIGTIYTSEAHVSLEVSADVEEAIQIGLWEVYVSQLGLSLETEFDWAGADMSIFDYEVEDTYEFIVPPGTKVIVEQVVGLCDGNESKTDSFRYLTEDTSGQVKTTYYKRHGDEKRTKIEIEE